MVATFASIASSFQRSAEGPWLLTMYTFGYIIALPVVCDLLNRLLLRFAYTTSNLFIPEKEDRGSCQLIDQYIVWSCQ